MGDAANRLYEQALALSEADRETLIERLRQSLVEPRFDTDYADAWTDELTRRLAEVESGRAKLLSVPDAMALIRSSRDSTR